MGTYVESRRATHKGRTMALMPAAVNPVVPKPGGPPVPIVNIAHAPGLDNGTASVRIDGQSAAVDGAYFNAHPATPDRIGGIAGTKSGVVGGVAQPLTSSKTVLFEDRGAVRSFDSTENNGLLLFPGFAQALINAVLPDPLKQLGTRILSRLPGALQDQLAALKDSLTDPSVLVGMVVKAGAKLVPGLGQLLAAAQMAQVAQEVAALAQEVQRLATPPLTPARQDEIADLVAAQIAASIAGFVAGKVVRRMAKPKPAVARADAKSNSNDPTGRILDDAAPALGFAGGNSTKRDCQTCHPVVFATGVKVLEATDFELPGLIPLVWTRSYRSSDRRDGWFGAGWSTPLSVELSLLFDQVQFHDEAGRLVRLPRVARGASFFEPRHRLTLWRSEHDEWRIEQADGLTLQFGAPVPGQWRLALQAQVDRNGNAITLHYPAFERCGLDGRAPRPQAVTDSAGRRLQLRWAAAGWLERVALASPEHEGGMLELARYACTTEGNAEGDAQANLVQASDALGNPQTYRYQRHLMVAYTTANGFTHHQQWSRLDAAGRVVRTWCDEPGLLETHFAYDLAARVTTVTDALGRVSRYHYDAHHDITRIEEPGPDGEPIVTETRFDASGNPLAATDALGRQTSYRFDAAGNVTSVTDAAGHVTRVAYNALNLAVEVIDALGGVWTNAYDARGNLVAQVDALGHETRYTVDERGLPVAITDALGKRKRLEWNARGELVAYTDCSGQTTRYAWDALGQLARSTDALGQPTVFTHDALGRLRELLQPDGALHRYAYDGTGNLVAYRDPLNATTRYRYNGLDQPVERTDALGHSLEYVYDRVGRLVGLRNENHAWYRFAYDPADNLREEIGFDGRVQRYRYNAAGELTEWHERLEDAPFDPDPRAPLPKQTFFTRDALGRLVGKACNTEPQRAAFTHDALGRLTRAANDAGVVALRYDAGSRLIEEVQQHAASGARFVFAHEHDALGNRIASRLPSGTHVQWLYYGSGHLHRIEVDGHVLTDIERDALHRETHRSQGVLASGYSWDPMGRLAAHRVVTRAPQASTGTAFDRRDRGEGRTSDPGPARRTLPRLVPANTQGLLRQFGYDAAGNLVAVADTLRGATRYRYDATSRILAATNAAGQAREQFAFDPAGNILNLNQGGAHSSAGATQDRSIVPDNRVAVHQDHRYRYDVHGNVIERRIGWHTVQAFEHNAEHQIVAVHVTRHTEREASGQGAQGVTQTTQYRYDALGRRIAKADAFGSTAFAYDGDLLVHEQRGAKLSEYLYEPDGFVPLAKLESDAGAAGAAAANDSQASPDATDPRPPKLPKRFATYYYHCDQIGAPQELSDEQGRIVWAASWKVWGETEALEFLATGTDGAVVLSPRHSRSRLIDAASAEKLNRVDQPLRFQGQYVDAETELHYNRFRYYDPVTGRFTTQDPIGLVGGPNAFVWGVNSLRWIDPLGLAKRGPKTNGEGPHNETIRAWGADLIDGGCTIIAGGGRRSETTVDTPGGHKSRRRPDVIWIDPGKKVHYGNVGKTKADGITPVTREQKALEDLRRDGVDVQFRAYACSKRKAGD